MPNYRVRFIKILCDDTGHPHRCQEGEVNIRHARDRDRAVRAAKKRFARIKRIPRWDLFADAFELEIEPEETSSSLGCALIAPY